MHRLLCVVAAILSCFWLAAPVWAEKVRKAEVVSVDEAFSARDGSVCGNPESWTAIRRVPPVRTVVFDPISNSFAYVTCPGEPNWKKGNADDHRLALTTQKIRVLILPYNPLDGDLALEKTDGEGVEFTDIIGGPLPPQKTGTTATERGTGEEATEKKPEKPEPPNASLPAIRRRVQEMAGRSDQILEEEERRNDPYSNMAVLEVRWGDYSQLADEVSEGLQFLLTKELCIRGNLETAAREFTREVTRDPKRKYPAFSLAEDVTFEQLKGEAERRLDLIGQDFYVSCNVEPQASGFQGDISAFDVRAAELAIKIEELKRQAQETSRSVQRLSPEPPPEISAASWRNYHRSMLNLVSQMKVFNASLEADLKARRQSAAQLRADHDRFQDALNSPAMHIQRVNYSPLGDGKSMTLTIRRGPKQPNDGANVPARATSIEIRSAPVHVMRFGMGLVASKLEDPVYQAIALTGSSGSQGSGSGGTGGGSGGNSSSPPPLNTLLLKEEGNGRVLPGLFLHHYWGRKSPLLDPTPFERWMPTLSLGIPVSEASALSQFFLGLNWELIPGFNVNAGYHFGKVNALINQEGIAVGKPLPAGVDASAVQKKSFGSDVYFGIVVNQDAFQRIFGNGGN